MTTRAARTRTIRTPVALAAIVAVLLVAAGCGSSAGSAHGSKRGPGSPAPKLTLLRAGEAAPAADAEAPTPITGPTSYVLDHPLPDLGAQAAVYRWTAHTPTASEVRAIAAAFGLHADVSATSDGFQAADGDETLTVTTSNGVTQVSSFVGGPVAVPGSIGGSAAGGSAGSAGSASSSGTTTNAASTGVSYGAGAPGPADAPPDTPSVPSVPAPVDVPTAAAAASIARDALDAAGVLAGATWDSSVNHDSNAVVGTSCAAGADCPIASAEPVRERDVTFTLMLAGAPVSGVSWNVTLGSHARIESVSGEWASAVSLGNYDLRSTTNAFHALQHGDADFGGVVPVAEAVPGVAGAPATKTVPLPAPVASPSPAPSPSPPRPLTIHVTGVTLGVARWDAIDAGENVVDLVPVFEFQTLVNGSKSSVEVLALDPDTIGFSNPIATPVDPPAPVHPPTPVSPSAPVGPPEPVTVSPGPEPAPVPVPTPVPAPKPAG